MNSPTSRSLGLMRSRGFPLVQVVEKWIPQARKRVDLFGFIDILCVSADGSVVALQTTSASNVSARIHKITDSASLALLRKAGWTITVHGWAKRKGRWQVREVDIS